jgi:hypothetical protein
MPGIAFYSEPRIIVPDLYDLAQATAESTITGAGLTVGNINSDYNETISAGNVYSQSPTAGTLVLTGSAVDINVSLGSAAVDTSFTIGSNTNYDGFTWGGQYGTFALRSGRDGGDPLHGWALFTGITIPQGATINSAHLELANDGTNLYGSPVVTDIYARDIDNTSYPTSANNLRNSDPVSPGSGGWLLTTAKVDWTVPGSAQHVYISTPSIVSILQEIVNRPGWQSGYAVCFVMKGDYAASTGGYRSFDSATSSWPEKLYVNYTPA